MKTKLTDALILKRKRPAAGRDEIFDTQVPGFGIRIGPRERAFFFIRRVKGRKARFSLGLYPAVSLSRARAQALEILEKINLGQDPRADHKRRKDAALEEAENTFGRIADRFIAEYAKGKKRPLRARTVKGYEWALTGEPTATWTNKTLVSVTDRDVIKAVDRYEVRKQFASARLLRAYLHKFFRWALEKRLCDKNPVANIALASSPSDFKRERVLDIEELQTVLTATNNLGQVYRAYVHALVLIGQRERETALMKWRDLTLEGASPSWLIPGANAKNRRDHIVPLAPVVTGILSQIPKIGEYVFTTNGTAPISGFSRIKLRLDDILEGRGLAHWTWHDLRRSAATGMADLGFPPHIIEEILNHISGAKAGVSGLYNKSRYQDERRRALEAWAKLVLGSDDHATNVVPLRSGAGTSETAR